MAVLINFKICDNDKACSGRSVCPNGVFSWNNEKKTLEMNNDLCAKCGACVEACTVSAIKMAKTEEEYKQIEQEYENDPRTINDLFIDRYGATPVDTKNIWTENEPEDRLISERPIVLELFNEDSIMCLLKSIPVKEILEEFDVNARYRKIEILTDKLLDKYSIKELPALVFIKNQKVLGTIEGYYTDENNRELFNKIYELKNGVEAI